MSLSYEIAATNRNNKMEKSNIDFDRKIKKSIITLLLQEKFYGSFVVVGKNDNNVDYLIRFASKPKSKIKQS
ncbi:hypothetical protein BpHYR1_007119 [Brachionus plicatilis]|uniref:Uncharacterized protein n=1 Tax=Brachionus plicatilis TaxID=10195 RepID=A0A3M7QYE1_BRAPC|nr:hypothetical protein BpHYR1_007119 [Brachionus plicatilis]